jgi:tetratricopeptide (TPR) repeat protein
MKKSIVVIFLLNVMCISGIAQDYYKRIDSLNNSLRDSIMYMLASPIQDITRVNLLNDMCNYFKFDRPDSALYYGYEAISLARQIKFPEGEVRAMHNIALSQNILGNFSKGLQIILQGIKIADKNNLAYEKARLLINLGGIYRDTGDYNKALSIYNEGLILFDSLHRADFIIVTRSFIGNVYLMIDKYDSALYHNQLAYDDAVRLHNNWVSNIALIQIGKLQEKLGNTSLALRYFRQSTEKATAFYWLFQSDYSIARFYQHTGMLDSCIYYARESLEISQKSGIFSNIIDASILLADIYDKTNPQKALEYNKMAMAYKDSIYNIGNNVAFEYFTSFDEQERQYELDTAKTEFRNRLRMNAFLGSTFTLIVIAIFLFRSNWQKQRSKQNIEKAYDQLKSTQSQLIQSEKMASLGELTAGIAHEIQNPLNFVNNF